MNSGADDPCEHGLSSDDYSRLPETARAYEGSAENSFLRVTPSILKFPHDDPSLHLTKLVLWNKTKKRVNFRLSMTSHARHFDLIFEKSGIYGGGEETVLVKLRPYDQRLICTSLKIQVGGHGGADEELNIPVELVPNSSWFQLPRVIIMPIVPIGNRFDAVLPLPKVPEDEDDLYFFIFHGNTQTVTVSPTEGTIGRDGVDSLRISYHPREYTTIAHILYIHFPTIQKRPYEITLYLRSNPTSYGRQEICTFPRIKKVPPKPTKLKSLEQKVCSTESINDTEDLTTPAAVAKFLLKPAGRTASATDLTSPTGLSPYEEHKAYKREEKNFYEKVAQFQTLQQNLHLQPSRAFVGEVALEEESEMTKEIMAERDNHRFLYNKKLGLETSILEDLTRGKTKLSKRRGLRDLDMTSVPPVVKVFSVAYDPVHRHILRPFTQAAITIITRFRAGKRLVKIRVLVKQKRKEMTGN